MTWVQVKELLDLQIPWFPKSKPGLLKFAARQGWKKREVTTRGGKAFGFELSSLPPHIQEAILKKRGDSSSLAATAVLSTPGAKDGPKVAFLEERRRLDEKRQEGMAKFAALKGGHPKRLRALARFWVLEELRRFEKEHGQGYRSKRRFCERLGSDIEIPEEHRRWLERRGKLHLSPQTLYRWQKRYDEWGTWGLVDGYGKRKDRSKIDDEPEVRDFIAAQIAKFPHVKPRVLWQLLQVEFPWFEVSEATIYRYLKRWKEKNHALWTYLTNPDEWKSRYLPAVGSLTESVTRLNQVWEIDATPGDWLLKDGRHVVLGCIDSYSRRLKFLVTKISNAQAVGQLIRRCILDWGVPEAIRCDNGKEFLSHFITTVLKDLHIRQEVCAPFSPEQKGIIERAFRTMAHGVLELLPGFCGHNIAERKAIEARKAFAKRVLRGETIEVALTSSELQEILDRWCQHFYENEPHKGLGGKTPREVARAWKGYVRRVKPEALNGLLLPLGGPRIVQKKGIQFEGRFYVDPEGKIFLHVGEEVEVRPDPDDIGRIAVFLEGRFLCWAECPEVKGISRKALAETAKKLVKGGRVRQARALRKLAKAVQKNPAVALLEASERQNRAIVDFPKPAIEHDTEALREYERAIQECASTPEPPSSLPLDPPKEAPEVPDDPVEAFGFWMAIKERIERGEEVPERLRKGLQIYLKSDEFRSLRRMVEMGMGQRLEMEKWKWLN